MAKAFEAAGLHRASLGKLHDLDAALELMYYGWRCSCSSPPAISASSPRTFQC
jgi:hypothetical protein